MEAQRYKSKEEIGPRQVDRLEKNWKPFQQGIGHMCMFEVMGNIGHLIISKKALFKGMDGKLRVTHYPLKAIS